MYTEGMIGRLLGGRYRLVRRLGSGGMGTVYLCEHAVLSRRYALKVLHADRASDPEVVERFRQEARAASQIDQENVIEVLDFGEDPSGELFYVMEALDGRTLTQVMREDGPLPVERALALFEQVCKALAAAHGRGVVHRDVKPDNVLVERLDDGSERCKLIDFGISHVPGADRLTRDGEIIGTPEYMAPEQASGSEVDALTDVYAAGVLAYELITGTLPIVGSTAVATLVAHQTQAPEPPSARRPGVPPEVDRLLLRALAKRPGDRQPSMKALAAEVMRVRVTAFRPATGRDGGWSEAMHGTGWGGTISLAAGPVDAGVARTQTPGSMPAAARATRRPFAPKVALAVAALALVAAVLVAVATSSRVQVAPASAMPPPVRPAVVAPPPPAVVPAAAPAPGQAASTGVERAPTPARAEPAPGSADVKDPYAAPSDQLKPDPFR